MSYIITTVIVSDTVDNYMNGENPDTTTEYVVNVNYSGDTIKGAVLKVINDWCSNLYSPDDYLNNIMLNENNVELCTLVGNDYAYVSDEKYADWKNGNCDLISRVITFKIFKSVDTDELNELFNN